MIAIDTSSLIAYLSGHAGLDVEATGLALEHRQAVLPPVVLSELLSEPRLRADVKDLLVALPMLDLVDGYWERAGLLRAKTLGRKRKAALADVLIAQACLDHDVELITRDDHDFNALAVMAGLRLDSGSGSAVSAETHAPRLRDRPEPEAAGRGLEVRPFLPALEDAQLVLDGAAHARRPPLQPSGGQCWETATLKNRAIDRILEAVDLLVI